ncbi:deoxyribonuclease IV [Bacillus sp. BGMRC 2118]|nr:deoxyribonuclease IV [Bacillus sp. BGMRC 2118]
MLIGCHVSIRDGYLGAAKRAHQIGATAYQYFPKNPRSLSVKEINAQDASECKDFCKGHNIVSVAHTPYPTNLTPSSDKRKLTIDSLLNDLEIAEACGSIGVVVHFGSQIDTHDPLKGYLVMIEMLNEVLINWHGDALVLLENVAGKPGVMGTTLEEQVQIRNLCKFPDKVGFCLDTCHAFASDEWTGEKYEDFMQKGNELSYFKHLKVIHLNNSKYENGSGKDRHANIDSGKIDISLIGKLLKEKSLSEIPFVLETPGEDHKNEINLVRGLSVL